MSEDLSRPFDKEKTRLVNHDYRGHDTSRALRKRKVSSSLAHQGWVEIDGTSPTRTPETPNLQSFVHLLTIRSILNDTDDSDVFEDFDNTDNRDNIDKSDTCKGVLFSSSIRRGITDGTCNAWLDLVDQK